MLRWAVLALNCLLLLGNYYAYDNPAAMRTQLKEYLDLGDNFDHLFGLLYSVYSLPNIFLPFLAGMWMDRWGAGRVLILLSACVCAGQSMVLYGVVERNQMWMLAGRALFGLGGESISVAQSCITARWFRGKELAFALSWNLAVPRLGSVLNTMVSPRLDVVTGFGVGLALCMASFLCVLLLVFGVGTAPKEDERVLVEDEHSESAPEREPEREPLLVQDTNEEEEVQEPTTTTSEDKHIAPTERLPATLWLLCLVVMLIYGTIIPFNMILQEFLQVKWFAGRPELAGQWMSIPDTVCTLLVPLCGYAVDRIQWAKMRVLVLCCALISGVHLSLGWTDAAPTVALVLLGIAYSLYGAAYWRSVADLFQEGDDRLAFAYGITTSAMNLSLTVVPLLIPWILGTSTDFTAVELFFAAEALVAMGLCLWMSIIERKG